MDETKILKTPSGKELTIPTHITARDRNKLRREMLNSAKADPTTGKPQIPELIGDFLEQTEHATIRFYVRAYAGETEPEKILEALLSGDPADYDYALAELNKIANFKPAN